jgi:hypothetical protein
MSTVVVQFYDRTSESIPDVKYLSAGTDWLHLETNSYIRKYHLRYVRSYAEHHDVAQPLEKPGPNHE